MLAETQPRSCTPPQARARGLTWPLHITATTLQSALAVTAPISSQNSNSASLSSVEVPSPLIWYSETLPWVRSPYHSDLRRGEGCAPVRAVPAVC